jgi:hypothetical protein
LNYFSAVRRESGRSGQLDHFMNRLDVRVIPDAAAKRRIVIFQRCSGTYGFEEQRFLDGPLEYRWLPVGTFSKLIFDSEEQTLHAAHDLVPGLPEANPLP